MLIRRKTIFFFGRTGLRPMKIGKSRRVLAYVCVHVSKYRTIQKLEKQKFNNLKGLDSSTMRFYQKYTEIRGILITENLLPE